MAYLIDPRVWDDERFIQLTEGAQLTWLLCLSGPQRRPLPGLFRCGPAALAETRRRPVQQIMSELQQLAALRLIQYDSGVHVIRVPNAPRHASTPNRNILRSWFRQWKDVPDCALKYLHLGSLQSALAQREAIQDEWQDTFGHVLDQIHARGLTLETYCHGLQSTMGVPAVQLELLTGSAARQVS